MTLNEIRSRYRNEIIAAAEKRGARNVRIFGSVARVDQRQDSDIDFLVDFEPGRSLLDLTGLWLDLEAVLGCKVDLVSSRGLKLRLESEVTRDAVSL
jgi:predicted nucleotidyltransferase